MKNVNYDSKRDGATVSGARSGAAATPVEPFAGQESSHDGPQAETRNKQEDVAAHLDDGRSGHEATATAELNSDVADVLAAVRVTLGDHDEPQLGREMLDENDPPTGEYHCCSAPPSAVSDRPVPLGGASPDVTSHPELDPDRRCAIPAEPAGAIVPVDDPYDREFEYDAPTPVAIQRVPGSPARVETPLESSAAKAVLESSEPDKS